MRKALIALEIKGIPGNHAIGVETTWCDFRSMDCDVTNLGHAEMPMKKFALRNCNQCGVTGYERHIILSNRAKMVLLIKVSWKQRDCEVL